MPRSGDRRYDLTFGEHARIAIDVVDSIGVAVSWQPAMAASDSPPPADAAGRFSIERLSSAFARLMGVPAGQTAPPTASPDEPLLIDDGDAPPSPQMIVEGMLFVGRGDGKPLTARELAEPIRGVEREEVVQIIDRLNGVYAAGGEPWEIVADGGGFRMQLRSEFEDVRRRLRGNVRAAKLTPAAIEVLSLVAYRQPITAEAINKVRGVRSHPVLASLVRRELVAAQREADDQGVRLTRYRTTERFNRVFGIASPAELPRSEDLDDC